MSRKSKHQPSRLARLRVLEDEIRAMADEYALWRAGLPAHLERSYAAVEVDTTIQTLTTVAHLLRCALPAYNAIPF